MNNGRFPPGHTGRPLGTKNKLAIRVFQDVLKVWNEPANAGAEVTKGVAALRVMFIERPHDFVKVVASILPRDFNIEAGMFAEMDDAKLEQISMLAQRLLEEHIDGQDKEAASDGDAIGGTSGVN